MIINYQCCLLVSLLQPGPKKFLFKIELIYKAKKFKVPPFTMKVVAR